MAEYHGPILRCSVFCLNRLSARGCQVQALAPAAPIKLAFDLGVAPAGLSTWPLPRVDTCIVAPLGFIRENVFACGYLAMEFK